MALIASIAFAGFAAGSASALSVEPPNENFVMSSGPSWWKTAGQQTWECSGSGSGSGSFVGGTGGTMTLTFQNCGGGGLTCTTPGQPKGTIKTSSLGIKPVYLDAAHTTFGLLLSPPETGWFAQFTCGFLPTGWKGSVIGAISKPALNVFASAHTLMFNQGATPGSQMFEQVEGSGPKYHLTQNGESIALVSEQTMKFSNPVKYLP